ncbi:MAG: NTP transferase domain-containing protein [Syntrophales bacterium]|nr:NTP transferase domain-containing protein [Syntrophales bacterium]
MKQKPLSSLILAAGKGTRMQSDLAKVLHTLCGRPMLAYSLDVAKDLGSERIVVIIGHQADLVREQFTDEEDIIFVEQREQLGTGHAVLQAAGVFRGYAGNVLILCGDVPLLKKSTLDALIDCHQEHHAVVTVMTVVLENPGSYGRVVKNADGEVLRIVEAKDAGAVERAIGEINTGIYCVDSGFLFDAVARITNQNAQREYYLTDIMEIACINDRKTMAFVADDPVEVMGINTPEDLERAGRIKMGQLSGDHSR